MNEILREKLMKFMGIGNPESKIWFISIEEVLTAEKLRDIELLIGDNEFSYFEEDWYIDQQCRLKDGFPKKRFSPIYDLMADIILAYSGRNLHFEKNHFINNLMLAENGYSFMTNLFPIGKVRATDKVSTDIINKLGFNNIKDYFKVIRNERFPRIKAFWEKYNPDFTICLGTPSWKESELLFDIKSVNISKDPDYQIFKEERIIMLPYHLLKFYTRDVKNVIDIMKSFDKK